MKGSGKPCTFVALFEIAAVMAVAFAILGLFRKRRIWLRQERLNGAFERAQAQRANGCVLQGNALIDPNF